MDWWRQQRCPACQWTKFGLTQPGRCEWYNKDGPGRGGAKCKGYTGAWHSEQNKTKRARRCLLDAHVAATLSTNKIARQQKRSPPSLWDGVADKKVISSTPSSAGIIKPTKPSPSSRSERQQEGGV